jgi:hypothetical protein
MSDEKVQVDGLTQDNAILLLEAAEKLDLDASVVETTSDGHFLVPKEVADKAFPKGKTAAKKDDKE